MNAKGFSCLLLAATLLSLALPQGTLARALLVIGSTEGLWPATSGLETERRGWIETAAHGEEGIYPDFNKTTRGMIQLDISATHVAPFSVTPDVNLSLGYEERGGRLSSEFCDFSPALDGNTETSFVFPVTKFLCWPKLDLGGVFPVNRIRFHTHPDRVTKAIDWFTLYVNDGDPQNLTGGGSPRWDEYCEPLPCEIRWETENSDWEVVTEFPLRLVRHVSIKQQDRALNPREAFRFSNRKPAEIAEFEVYGEGFVPKATYISEIIDISQVFPDLPGTQASWGRLHWIGSKDENARVVIRTRTGLDEDPPDPSVYWWIPGRGDEVAGLTLDGQPLTLRDYNRLPPTQRGPREYDTENWSFWSPPYDFDRGVEGVPMTSPGPARYFQFRIDFHNTITDGSRLEAIGFDFSKPPSASRAVAEIFPREVRAGVDTVFTYTVLPTLTDITLGFDSLEIETYVRPSSVRSLRVGADTVCAPCLPQTDAIEILDDRLIVHFEQLQGIEKSKTPVEVVFETQVVRYGAEFRSWIYDQDLDEVRQLVEGGDASSLYTGSGVAVTFPLSGQLIDALQVTPRVLTPNGDRINDQVVLSCALLHLSEAGESQVTLYDLAGRRVRRLQSGLLLSGKYEWFWDGSDDEAELVPPGNYIYFISVKADERRDERSGIIAVAY